MRCLCLGCLADEDAPEAFVDLCAAAFRLIDHTQFDRYASRMLTELGCNDAQQVWTLLSL